MNENEVNPNGKHQWYLWINPCPCWKRKKNMIKLGAIVPVTHIIVYEWCMKVGVALTPSTLNR
jgi:hypothetical protein